MKLVNGFYGFVINGILLLILLSFPFNTLSQTQRDTLKEHGEGPLGGDYKILKQKVPAKSIWTNADSIHEYGYWPD